VKASIEEVIHTFVEALILVLIVVFLFLQNWRATLIPMLAVPVSLVATFAAFEFLGFSINTLSLFGMVLAIGIVVDSAIVVVGRRTQDGAGLKVREATIKAMEEVRGPVIAIALILAAVLCRWVSSGCPRQLYKQFAVTVAVSTMFSALVALVDTGAVHHAHEAARGKPQPAGTVLQGFQFRFRLAEHPIRIGRCPARAPHADGAADARRAALRNRRPVQVRAVGLRTGRGQGRGVHAGRAAGRCLPGAH
jgi:multidrug efflux pump subunit AcrB